LNAYAWNGEFEGQLPVVVVDGVWVVEDDGSSVEVMAIAMAVVVAVVEEVLSSIDVETSAETRVEDMLIKSVPETVKLVALTVSKRVEVEIAVAAAVDERKVTSTTVEEVAEAVKTPDGASISLDEEVVAGTVASSRYDVEVVVSSTSEDVVVAKSIPEELRGASAMVEEVDIPVTSAVDDEKEVGSAVAEEAEAWFKSKDVMVSLSVLVADIAVS
jgi:hypothetical protein